VRQDRDCARLRFPTAAAESNAVHAAGDCPARYGQRSAVDQAIVDEHLAIRQRPHAGDRHASQRRRRHLHGAAFDEAHAEILIEEIAIRAQAERAQARDREIVPLT